MFDIFLYFKHLYRGQSGFQILRFCSGIKDDNNNAVIDNIKDRRL
jgi:hypothetical protein